MIPTLAPAAVPTWSALVDRSGRLSIVDDDSQLSSSVIDGVHVWFDGYLYGSDRIAGSLGLPTSASFAAVVAAGFRQWGSAVFEHLDGGFCAIIQDTANGKVLVGRDSLGKHPVFIASGNGRTVFSSNVLTVADLTGRRGLIDRATLALRLMTFWPRAGATFFSGVERLRPGTMATIGDAGTWDTTEYWQPVPADHEPFLDGKDVPDRIEATLQEAVNDALALGVNGLMLSGGLDSVTVAALAQPANADLLACCGQSSHDDPATYEQVMQNEACRVLGIRQLVGTPAGWLGDRGLLAATLDLVPAQPTPTNIFWTASYFGFYQQAAAAGAPFLLTGSGGDEWFGVHSSWMLNLIRRRQFKEAAAFASALSGTGGFGWKETLGRTVPRSVGGPLAAACWERVAPGRRRAVLDRRFEDRFPEWLRVAGGTRAAVLDWDRDRRIEPLTGGRFPRDSYRHTTRQLWHSNPYHTYELERRHHVAGLAGVRLLSPYQAKPVVDLLNRVHPRLLLEGGRTKGPLRSIVEARVPELGIGTQRKWYDPTIETFVARSLRTQLVDAWDDLGCRTLSAAGLVDEQQIRVLMTDVDRLSYAERARLFTVLSVERWLAAQESAACALSIQ